MTVLELILGALLLVAGLAEILADRTAVRVVGVCLAVVGLALIATAVGWLPT